MSKAEILKQAAVRELQEVILPYWMGRAVDLRNGGFWGAVDHDDCPLHNASKVLVLNARLVWSFSAAYRVLKEPLYLAYADRAYRYFCDHFMDATYGGAYYQVASDGTPEEMGKFIYGNGFALYALSEYYRATGSQEALDLSRRQFSLLMQKAYSEKSGGFLEFFSRDWSTSTQWLHQKPAMSMNTHLHILEPFTNFYRIDPSQDSADGLRLLIRLFLDHIIGEDGHLLPYFETQWQSCKPFQTFGHDIEASWLLKEAAEVLKDPALTAEVDLAWPRLLKAALEGRTHDGSMIYERYPDGHEVRDRVWWVQAEQVVGCVNAWQFGAGEEYLDMALRTMDYIGGHLSDGRNGEWFHRCDDAGVKNSRDPKVTGWKCPYHNSRMCLEIIERC